MRLVIQRVTQASIVVEQREVAKIGPGMVIFAGFTPTDRPSDFPTIVESLLHLRLFGDEAGRLDRSLTQIRGEVLLVPEITLQASLTKGQRPSFDRASPPAQAKSQFQAFVEAFQACHPKVATGIFQAHMLVSLHNDGPVTFVIDHPPAHTSPTLDPLTHLTRSGMMTKKPGIGK